MDLVLTVLIVLAVVAVVGGVIAGRKHRQGPQPRFEGEGHRGDVAEHRPKIPPDPGTDRPAGPGAEDMAVPEPGDPGPADPRADESPDPRER